MVYTFYPTTFLQSSVYGIQVLSGENVDNTLRNVKITWHLNPAHLHFDNDYMEMTLLPL